ncbi:MAG: HAD family phosphatase [Actinomycetota bacterium]|nr:HAD family phosphatase [Actinomycetota bacterium]
MSESNVDALVIDFGGVLTTSLQDALAAFAESAGVELQDLVRVALGLYTGAEDPLVHDFEIGAISDEEFGAGLSARLHEVSGVRVSPYGLVARMFAVDLEEDMLSAVAAIRRAGFKTALLSNSWGSSLYPRDRLVDLFDAVVISGEVGMRKPDPRIYALALERIQVAPQRCVFVDDHPGHLAAARDLGLMTLLHRSSQETIEALETLLGVELRDEGQR